MLRAEGVAVKIDQTDVFSGSIFVDAHVHLHPPCDPGALMSAVAANFRHVVRASSTSEKSYIGAICLAEIPGEMAFQRIGDWLSKDNGGWRARPTSEAASLLAQSPENDEVLVVAGRQIQTKEGLEVLALGTTEQFPDGLGARAAIAEIRRSNAVPVVPWGLGKWSGSRRGVLQALIRDEADRSFFLGDSGNRPGFWNESSVWDLARHWQIRNLPGTDPLPFGQECNRAGTYGFAFEGMLDLDRPAESLLAHFVDRRIDVRPYGRPEHFARFVRNQVVMQYRKLIGTTKNRKGPTLNE